MKISVKVKPRSKIEKLERSADGSYKIWVRAVADKGKANEAVIGALSKHFGVAKSTVAILSGHTSSNKLVEIRGKA